VAGAFEEERAVPKWIVPLVGVVLIVAVVLVLLAHEGERSTEPLPNLPWMSADAERVRRASPQELQRLMLGDDRELAISAAVQLSVMGDEGWQHILPVLPDVDPAIANDLQQRDVSQHAYDAAFRAITDGPEKARRGAYVLLQGLPPMTSVDEPFEDRVSAFGQNNKVFMVFRTTMLRLVAAEAEARDVYAVVSRIHPRELSGFFSALAKVPEAQRTKALKLLMTDQSTRQLVEPKPPTFRPSRDLQSEIQKSVERILAEVSPD
jgi:hypothetical protein